MPKKKLLPNLNPSDHLGRAQRLLQYAKKVNTTRPCYRAHLQREAAVSLAQWIAEWAEWGYIDDPDIAAAITVARGVIEIGEEKE